MKRFLVLLMFFSPLVFAADLLAQNVGIPYTPDFKLIEGIYLTYDEFKNNSPSIKEYEMVLFIEPKGDEKIKYRYIKYIVYKDADGHSQKLKLNAFWGLCDENGVFILIYEVLHQIETIGAIMPIKMNFKTAGSYEFGFSSGGGPTTIKNKLFIVFETGSLFQYSRKSFEFLIKQDKELLKEFDAIKGNKKKYKQIPEYIDRYNERHPISFPSGVFGEVE